MNMKHDIVINIYKLKKNAMTEILFKNIWIV